MNRSAPEDLNINAIKEIDRLTEKLRNGISNVLKKRGAVVGISGGIDSSVVLSLCRKALGPERVLAVLMPERESEAESTLLAKELARQLAVSYIIEDITNALEGFGCYKKRDDAIKSIFPEYTSDYKAKITISNNDHKHDQINFFQLTIISPSGQEKSARLPVKEYLQIVAASNMKQRSRMNFLYYHAELRNYAVIGTGNKNEHYQGFFVKHGDGAADIKPIAHLFKTQVYQLAEYLDIPKSIKDRIPTTDTYSASQTQEEFFFGLPFKKLDYIWHNWELGFPAHIISEHIDLPTSQVENIINDIKRKMHTTDYLRKEAISLSE